MNWLWLLYPAFWAVAWSVMGYLMCRGDDSMRPGKR